MYDVRTYYLQSAVPGIFYNRLYRVYFTGYIKLNVCTCTYDEVFVRTCALVTEVLLDIP